MFYKESTILETHAVVDFLVRLLTSSTLSPDISGLETGVYVDG